MQKCSSNERSADLHHGLGEPVVQVPGAGLHHGVNDDVNNDDDYDDDYNDDNYDDDDLLQVPGAGLHHGQGDGGRGPGGRRGQAAQLLQLSRRRGDAAQTPQERSWNPSENTNHLVFLFVV